MGHVPWASEISFQKFHSVVRFLRFSNNLGNLVFARRTTPMTRSDRALIRSESKWIPPSRARLCPIQDALGAITVGSDLSEECDVFRIEPRDLPRVVSFVNTPAISV